MKINPLIKDYLSPVLRLPYGGGSFRSSNPAIQAKKNVNLFRMKEMVILHNSLKLMRDELTASKRQ
jgi:hypothetical protein